MIKTLLEKVKSDKESQELKDYANTLYDMALIQSGFSIDSENIPDYSARLMRIVQDGMGVDANAEIEEMPEFIDDEEEEEDEDEDEDEEEDEEELDDDAEGDEASDDA